MFPDRHDITLVLVPADELLQTNLRILKHFTPHFDTCLYLSVNFDYNRLIETLHRHHLDPKKFFVIDCLGGHRRNGQCISLPSPSALTELGIAMSQAIQSLPPGQSFLVVDALSTLVVYNPPDYVARFAHFLISKAKAAGIPTILLAAEKEMGEPLYAEVAQFCDRVLKPQQLRVK